MYYVWKVPGAPAIHGEDIFWRHAFLARKKTYTKIWSKWPNYCV